MSKEIINTLIQQCKDTLLELTKDSPLCEWGGLRQYESSTDFSADWPILCIKCISIIGDMPLDKSMIEPIDSLPYCISCNNLIDIKISKKVIDRILKTSIISDIRGLQTLLLIVNHLKDDKQYRAEEVIKLTINVIAGDFPLELIL